MTRSASSRPAPSTVTSPAGHRWAAGPAWRHSGFLTARAVRTLLRQPAFAAITLVQPVLWLLLFGQLFRNVVHIPGFSSASGSYLEFITPGVVVMTALFSSGWAGTVFIEDMDRGVMDRLLASPVRRGAMIVGTLAYQSLTTVVQTLIVFGIAYLSGARFDGGAVGVLVTLLAACLISVVIASFSNAIALLVRQQEALIGISQFIVLPLQFLSVGDHGHAGGAGLGAPRRAVQPGRLGLHRGPVGAVGRSATGQRSSPAWDCSPCWRS